MLLILHQGAIGDFILALSVIQPAAEKLDAEQVVAVASADSARLAAGRSCIDRCVHPDAASLHTLFASKGPLHENLQRLLDSAHWILSFLGGPETTVHARLTAHTAGQVIAIDPRPTATTLSNRTHITEQWAADLAGESGPAIEPQPPVIRIESPGASHSVQSRSASSPKVIIHPGSGGQAKCWPTDRYLDLADRLAPLQACWMLGPAELEIGAEKARAIQSRALLRNEPLITEFDLSTAVRAMSALHPAVYIGNDGGMTHVAAAIGLPVLALYGPTDPAMWRPLGSHVNVCATQHPGTDIGQLPVMQVLRALRVQLANARSYADGCSNDEQWENTEGDDAS